MVNIFSNNPIILLFAVASLGYLFGSFKIKGQSLGLSAILFVGLLVGGLNNKLVQSDSEILEGIFLLGLCIFSYSVGLSSGPAFFKSYQKNGLKDFTFILGVLCFTGLISVGLFMLFGFSAASISGIYTGSTTNTAAMAGVLDYVKNLSSSATAESISQQVVIGYSFSYPMGVLGGMIAIVLMERWLKIDYEKEKHQLKNDYPVAENLSSASVEITNQEVCNISIRALKKRHQLNIIFGRVDQKKGHQLSNWDTRFDLGDEAMIVGAKEELERAITILGKRSKKKLSYDRTIYDTRRIFVSNPIYAGKTIASLNLEEDYNAVITRIRRGDMDMLAQRHTVIELGDRIRFVAKREDLTSLSKMFGDSYQDSNKVNLFSFGLGIGLGLIIGSLNIPIPFTTIQFQLGYAGGPLIIGLLLGALRRTGGVVWSLSYGANVTLQQIGLILLLSVIGLRSGTAFFDSLSFEALQFFIASAIISLSTAFITLWVGYQFFKKPFSLLLGMVANQPAILDFAMARCGNKIPEFGFSMIFPIALIMKIIIAQLLYIILS